jgi:chromosome segregation ATPase
MSTAVSPTIQDLESQIHGIAVKRGLHESKFARLTDRLIEIDARAGELKVRLAGGEQKASALLDQLDDDRRQVSRELAGLRTLIDGFEAQAMPLQAEVNAINERARIAEEEAAKEAERRKRIEWEENLRATADRFQEQYAAITGTLAELMMIGAAGAEKYGADAQDVFGRLVMERFRSPMTDLRNRGWRQPLTSIYRKRFEIEGLVPPGHPGVHKKKS